MWTKKGLHTRKVCTRENVSLYNSSAGVVFSDALAGTLKVLNVPMPARSSTRSPRRPQNGHRHTRQTHSSSSDSSSPSEESDENSSLEQAMKQDTGKRKGKRGSSVPKNLDSYEYRGKLIVVKRKPPVIFERDSSKSYDVEDMSKYYVGSERDPYQLSRHGSPYYTDTASRRWGICDQENDIDYPLSSSRTNEILYDSGYYRVTDPGFRSPNVREIMNFKVSKNGQYLNRSSYQTTYDMMDGRGEFEKALSGNLRWEYL